MEKYADLSTEAISTLAAEKRSAFDALIALDAPTIEQVDEAEALAVEIGEILTEQTNREVAAAAAGEKFAALKNRKFGADASETEPEPEPTEAEPEDDEDEAPVQTEETKVEETKTVKPAASRGVATLAAKVTRPVAPVRGNEMVSITAAADVPDIATGTRMEGVEQIATATINRMRGFAPPTGDGMSENLQKFGIASIRMPFDDDLTIDRHSDDMEVLNRASKESRLPGNSLVAAGGWCAPSETLYDLCDGETLEGLLSVPEVNIKRGGIRYTEGPNFADFYGNANGFFKQTEAQAIAGATKPCVTVDCPAFVEVRLDAVGLCIKIPILTNAGYPELVARYISGFMTAYQHRLNAEVIGRMVAIAGAARVFTGIGSTAHDTLAILTLIADQRRQQRRLSMNSSYEVVVPFWVKNVIRNDLGLRTGRDASVVTDAEIMAHFAARGLSVSFVYDWQDLVLVDNAATTTVNEANSYPTTFQVLMYPAGTFVKGTTDVINLSAVYDAASLAVNVYTGLFMEEGLLIAKMCNQADLVTIPICSAGRTGAANLTCV